MAFWGVFLANAYTTEKKTGIWSANTWFVRARRAKEFEELERNTPFYKPAQFLCGSFKRAVAYKTQCVRERFGEQKQDAKNSLSII